MSNPRSEKAESDTDADPKVAGSRASEGDDDQSDGPTWVVPVPMTTSTPRSREPRRAPSRTDASVAAQLGDQFGLGQP